METKLNPYISFKKDARQAMEFYKSVFGGKLQMNTFKEFNASQTPGDENLIMHAVLETANGITLMASDTLERMDYHPGTNVSMSLSGENENEMKGYFSKLSAGGMVNSPLKKEVWGDMFGMCTDKFGINWMVNIIAKK
jgi:PhnB protein